MPLKGSVCDTFLKESYRKLLIGAAFTILFRKIRRKSIVNHGFQEECDTICKKSYRKQSIYMLLRYFGYTGRQSRLRKTPTKKPLQKEGANNIFNYKPYLW